MNESGIIGKYIDLAKVLWQLWTLTPREKYLILGGNLEMHPKSLKKILGWQEIRRKTKTTKSAVLLKSGRIYRRVIKRLVKNDHSKLVRKTRGNGKKCNNGVWLVWLGWVLGHINHCWLFNAKSGFYIYIVQYIGLIGRVGWVLTNCPGDVGSIAGRVIPKTQKMVLDADFLSTQRYNVRIKGKVKQSRERSHVLPYTSV